MASRNEVTAADNAVPSPGESTRRAFFVWVSGLLSLLTGLILGIPFLAEMIGPAFREQTRHFARVTRLSALPAGKPRDVSYADVRQDAFIEAHDVRNVWVIKHSEERVTVFSPVCPHLGCRYDWRPQSQHFVCPCHGSVFALDGKVLDGPAPRPLDTLPNKIEQGELLVEWERFEAGIPEKTVV